MLLITEAQVKSVLTMPKAIELVDLSFRQLAAGIAINHPRQRVILPSGSILHYMAAGNQDYFGVKVYSTNPKTGARFQCLLYRSSDGLQVANLEANHLGQIRTGAASGVATNHMARKDARILSVIGAGFQAETQIAAISCVRTLTEVRVWSRDSERRKRFATACGAKFQLNVRAAESAAEACNGSDIVVTATSSKEPVIESAWIGPGTHVNAMGSNWKHRRELPTELVLDRGATVAVDSVEDGRIESGDLIIPTEERPATPFPAVELSGIVAGTIVGRSSPYDITIFKSNGLAAQDIAAAGYVFEALSGYS